jgi:hypothetical protein
MQMNIPATFGPICFCSSLEEDWNVYGRMTDAKFRVRWAKNSKFRVLTLLTLLYLENGKSHTKSFEIQLFHVTTFVLHVLEMYSY